MPKKSNFVPSKIFKGEAKCYITGRTSNLDKHHVLHGRGIRPLAEEDGLWIWLSHDLHMDIHDKGYAEVSDPLTGTYRKVTDKELQALGQQIFIAEKMKEGYPEDVARDLFRSRYGRFYD